MAKKKKQGYDEGKPEDSAREAVCLVFGFVICNQMLGSQISMDLGRCWREQVR